MRPARVRTYADEGALLRKTGCGKNASHGRAWANRGYSDVTGAGNEFFSNERISRRRIDDILSESNHSVFD